jgi:hypothetical protein
VHDHLGKETEEEVLDQSECEARLGPVVAPFEDLQHVAFQLDIAIKVLFLERLNGDELLTIVRVAVLGLEELEVVFDALAGELGLFVLARSEFGCEPPEGSQDGEEEDKSQEDPRLQAPTPAPCDVSRDADEQADEEGVVERLAAGAFCG